MAGTAPHGKVKQGDRVEAEEAARDGPVQTEEKARAKTEAGKNATGVGGAEGEEVQREKRHHRRRRARSKSTSTSNVDRRKPKARPQRALRGCRKQMLPPVLMSSPWIMLRQQAVKRPLIRIQRQ